MFDHAELFDYYDVHALGDYTELPPLMRWMRAQMADRGYDRPIWFDDAFPAGVLANGASYPANYPVTAASYPAVYDLLRAVAREETVGDYSPEVATAWVRAYYGVAVARVGAAEGARGYRFERDGVPTWVLWNEDGALHLPEDPAEVPVALTLDLPVGTRTVEVSAAYAGDQDPGTETLSAAADQVTLMLTSVPVFVEIGE